MSKMSMLDKIMERRNGAPKTDHLFDSEDMTQVPFSFHKEYYDDRHKDTDDHRRDDFVKEYFNRPCGYLHLDWDINAYWTEVANRVMIPYTKAIYNALVERGHNEDNSIMYGDADGCMYWLPAEDPGTMVLVHENQSQDFLYICKEYKSSRGYPSVRHNFHIRQIWKDYDRKDDYDWRCDSLLKTYSKISQREIDLLDFSEDYLQSLNKEELVKFVLNEQKVRMSPDDFIKFVLSNVSWHEEMSDSHYEYSRRHNLDYYKDRGFVFGDWSRDFNGIYTDGRDGGYVISINSDARRDVRAENLTENFGLLKLISTCYLPAMAYQLDLKVDNPWVPKNQ